MENINIKNTDIQSKNANEHIRPGYSDPSPYPEIKVSGQNKYYAKLLLDDYAGTVSEFSAINQYLYHHFAIDNKYQDIRNALENISIVEMYHMEILARIIKMLGLEPIYVGTLNKFWDAKYVYYGKNLCDQLIADRQSEVDAIKNYEKKILMIKDPYIQDIIKRIILDEKIHLEIFNKYIKKYCTA